MSPHAPARSDRSAGPHEDVERRRADHCPREDHLKPGNAFVGDLYEQEARPPHEGGPTHATKISSAHCLSHANSPVVPTCVITVYGSQYCRNCPRAGGHRTSSSRPSHHSAVKIANAVALLMEELSHLARAVPDPAHAHDVAVGGNLVDPLDDLVDRNV